MSIFRSLRESRVLLASPGDVTDLRNLVRRTARKINAETGSYRDLTLLAWEDMGTVFNDAVPAQYQIVYPTDPKVRGLVAFFGERIGQPFPDKFPEGDIGSAFPDLLESAFPGIYEGVQHEGKTYKLVHPWKPDAVHEGGFPLTGTTFEVLGFFAEHHRRNVGGNLKPLNAFLCFSSPASVLQQDDARRAPWGLKRLEKAIEGSELDSVDKQAQIAIRLEQLPQLLNFARFIMSRGIVPRWLPDKKDTNRTFEEWYRENFGETRNLTEDQAFRGLSSYDVEDHISYFGRFGEVQNAVEDIERIIEKPDTPNVYWVQGSSGVGKSSFLRAGVIGRLLNSPNVNETFSHVVIRPGNLLPKAGASVLDARSPLRKFLALCLDALQMIEGRPPIDSDAAADLLQDYDSIVNEALPQWTADKLEGLLDRYQGPKDAEVGRLALGIDQFEEIVDMLVDPELGKGWRLFAAFIVAASRCPHLFIVATIRKERIPKLTNDPVIGALWTETSGCIANLELPAPHALKEIVRQPFIGLGQCTLSEDLVSYIVEGIMEFKIPLQNDEIGRVMPLVSIMLQRIYNKIGKKKWTEQYGVTKKNDDGDKSVFRDALEQAARQPKEGEKAFDPVIQLDETKDLVERDKTEDLTRLDGAIAALGKRSLDDAVKTGVLKAREDTLDKLLRRLVRWSGGNDDKQFSLRTIEMPISADEAALAKAMTKYRLLVGEGDNRVRLVHEMVLECWPEAKAFCVREKPLQEEAAGVEEEAKKWAKRGHDEEYLLDMMKYSADTAFDMLALWSGRYDTSPFNTDTPEPRDLVVRDYCLAMLAKTNDGGRLVKRSEFKATHLHMAAVYQRRDIVRNMLKRHPECVDFQRRDQRTAVLSTCFYNDIETFEIFVKYKAKLDIPDEDGWYPIHAAAVGGDVAFMKRMVEAGATFDIEKSANKTHPVRFAAENGHMDLMAYYLDELGTDIDQIDNFEYTPLVWAVVGEQRDIIQDLISRGADPLRWVGKIESPYLLKNALHIAGEGGLIHALEALIDEDVEIDTPMKNGMTALHLAAQGNYPATVEFLAKKRADLNARAINHFDKAALEKHKNAVQSSFEVKQKSDWTPLHLAVEAEEPKVVDALLDAGANPDLATADGQTALHIAVDKGFADIALRLSKRADTTLRDSRGETPLQLAYLNGRLALAKDLSRNGCSVLDYVGLKGFKPEHQASLLHAAAFDPDITKLRFALDRAKSANRLDKFGRSPLHYAAAAGLEDRVELLLAENAGFADERDLSGQSALELGCLSGDLDTVMHLTAALDAEKLAKSHPDLLHIAARAGSIPISAHVISLGYQIDAVGSAMMTPLAVAVICGYPDLAEWMCANDTDMLLGGANDPSNSPLGQAIRLGRVSILETMLKYLTPDAIPLDTLVRDALIHQNGDCAAALLEWADAKGHGNAVNRAEMGGIYKSQVARLDETLGSHGLRSERFEALL